MSAISFRHANFPADASHEVESAVDHVTLVEG